MPREPLTFWLPLGGGRAARLTVEVVEEPLGGLDPDIHREPSVQEMDAIATALGDRRWHFSKTF